MSENSVVKSLQDKYKLLQPYFNQKTRCIWAAIEAQSLGWGGITQEYGYCQNHRGRKPPRIEPEFVNRGVDAKDSKNKTQCY